jgi:hypothetical protein
MNGLGSKNKSHGSALSSRAQDPISTKFDFSDPQNTTPGKHANKKKKTANYDSAM